MSDPRTWSLAQCQERLMPLAMPCPNVGFGLHGRSCDLCENGTGKVYPLRERCGPSWHRQPCPTPDTCDCRGMSFIPVEPHLETLRAAALQAGFHHMGTTTLSGFSHVFTAKGVLGEATGNDDLLTCARALCVALQQEAKR